MEVGNDFCEILMVIINSKILKRKFITDTTQPLGMFVPGAGGNPVAAYFLSQQQQELNMINQNKSNSQQYSLENNI